MGQLTPLIAGKLVAFDTGPLIYYIEEHPDYLSPADELFGAFDSGAARGIAPAAWLGFDLKALKIPARASLDQRLLSRGIRLYGACQGRVRM